MFDEFMERNEEALKNLIDEHVETTNLYTNLRADALELVSSTISNRRLENFIMLMKERTSRLKC